MTAIEIDRHARCLEKLLEASCMPTESQHKWRWQGRWKLVCQGRNWSVRPVEGAEAKWREVLKTESGEKSHSFSRGEKSHSYTVTEIQEKSLAQRVEVPGRWLLGVCQGVACGRILSQMTRT